MQFNQLMVFDDIKLQEERHFKKSHLFDLENDPYSILDQSFSTFTKKAENQELEYIHPISQRMTGDLSKIIDFNALDTKGDLGFEDDIKQDFEEYIEDFSPTFHGPHEMVQ